MVAEVAGDFAAKMTGTTNEVACSVAERKQLGGRQALAMIKVAVVVFAVTSQMVSIAKVHTAHLPPVLKGLYGIGIWLTEYYIHTFIVFVELVERTRGGRLLPDTDIDVGGPGVTSNSGIAALGRLRLRSGRCRGRRKLSGRD